MSTEWYLDDFWMISGWFLDDFWMISEWFQDDFWMISGGFLEDFWMISGWYLGNIWMMRSGVLIEFQRGVFFCNSFAITHISYDCMWVISGWYVGDTENGIQKVEFKSSLCTQISTSWGLGKDWVPKVEFSGVYAARFHPAGYWS